MRAVNLIPTELRGAGGGNPGRTGSGVYIALGVLAALVVLSTAWAVAARGVTAKQNELTRVTAEAQTAEARANAVAPYAEFSSVRDKRVETVTSLSRSRFNWPYAIREVSRVMPSNVSLLSLLGTVAPGVQVEGAGGPASGLRTALAVPAIELRGCTYDQESVARYLARLRSIDGVTRVSLAQSEKGDMSTGGSGDCRAGSDKRPRFDIVVFFERSTAKAASAAGGTAPVAGGAAGAAAAAPAPANAAATPTSGSTK